MTPSLHLLLAGADDGEPALSDGVPRETMDGVPRPARLPDAEYLRDHGRDPNDLRAQRWGLIVPEGELGRRREALVRRLVEARCEQQGGHAVRVYRVPSRMDAAAAASWHRDVYLDEAVPESQRPFYQLILGDLDEVPLAVQQVQMVDGAVGRIAFTGDAGYEAYVEKLLRWERQPSPTTSARSLFFTAHDGTAATTHGYQSLVLPAIAAAQDDRADGEYDAREILEIGDPDHKPDRDGLLAALKAADPAVLFSISHGAGPPRGGWLSMAEQRQRQGAMCLGGSVTLTGEDVVTGPVLPGGIWFMLACFGAGTPGASVYWPWIEQLKQLGQCNGQIDVVLRGLPGPGEPPFISHLAKSLLSNPEGPIGFIGHVDLAWSYSFQEQDSSRGPQNRVRRFLSLLSYALRRDRVGLAHRELTSCALAAETELLTIYGKKARGTALAPAERIRLAHLWMLRQDLMGYLLLGDPAARLPIMPTSTGAGQADPSGVDHSSLR